MVSLRTASHPIPTKSTHDEEESSMTKQRVSMFLEKEPFGTASGMINAMWQEQLTGLGYDINAHYRQYHGRHDMLMPMANADRLRRVLGEPPADLAVYCDLGVSIRPPGPEIARKSVVIYNGLIGAQGTWLANPKIDMYCAYSPYMKDILTSLLTVPDWRRRQCLDPSAFNRVAYFVPALPVVERPVGDERMQGGDLPEELRRAIDDGHIIGHAIQPRKPDWFATFNILLQLNMLARENGTKPFRLVVDQEDFALIDYSLANGFPLDVAGPKSMLDMLGFTIRDLLIPVRFLSQPALFKLLKQAKFGLSYNIYPEPYGFYVLESVYAGCPVYTNGIGNNRHNLPPGHGIEVIETVDMAFGDLSAFGDVARRIYADVQAPEAKAEECRRGREYIARTYNREASSRTIRAIIERVQGETPAAVPFELLEIQRSPMVRLMDEQTGQVVSDFQHVTLEPQELGLYREVLGRNAGDVAREVTGGALDLLQGLFSRGVLSLRPVSNAK
jgi:glycosyltransferase involved in cell wall biosynthesis